MTLQGRLRELGLLVVIVAIYAVSLGRSADYGYVWDDVPEIEHNVAFDRPLADGLVLTQVERGDPELARLDSLKFGYDSYRPLLFTSYWIEIHAWGRSPGPLHATNVVLGALAIVLAFAVARRWLGSSLALVPTAVFALHPIQIEAVAYISARGDLLAGVFALLATYAALRGLDATTRGRAIGWAVGAAFAFAASLLAKEVYVALPVVVAVLAWSRDRLRARWWLAAALLAVAVVYLPFRAAMVSVDSNPRYGDALIGFPGTVAEYLRIVVLPFDLSIERLPGGHDVVGWLIAGAALIATTLAVRRAGWKAALPEWPRRVLAGIAWLVLLVAPSVVVVQSMQVVADRYLYVPLLGLAVAATAAGARLARWQPRLARPLAIAASLWTVMVLVVAWQQVPVWCDVSTLYRTAVEMAPDSSRAHYRVAVLAIQDDRWDLAVPELERAIELDHRNVMALNNLGVYLLRSGRYAEAETTFMRAVAANPARFNAWANLGRAQLAQGKRAPGCAALERALEINPDYASARDELARSCAKP